MAVVDFKFALEQVPTVLKGVPWTITIAIVAMLFGLVLGLLIALCRIYKIPVLNQLSILYISFIRGTPLIVQLYVFFYGVPVLVDYLNPRLGLQIDADEIPPLLYALVAYTINTAAYQAEIFRSSINATNEGQMEAAYSVGMTTRQGLMRIILPQAFLIALPNLGNVFIGLIKATSLAFAVKVVEVVAISKIIANDGYRFIEMYLVASIIYWVLCLVFEFIFFKLEKRMSRSEARIGLNTSA
ncbi:amino acid ABC transporter permease [Sporosarcina sp. 179-K 8C2 HS]|uniref:amino acid ABC transporter permease n=1 Tax=Sporosarcina sp. 179-K 8C2 HS TaxID=3142387 RepID=UPI0039A310E7